MGNCSCLLERPRVAAWDGDVDEWGLPAGKRSGPAAARGTTTGNGSGGGTKVKIRMTRGQLRRLLESAATGPGGGSKTTTTDEDVVAEVMRMGAVRVEVVPAAAAGHRRLRAAEKVHQLYKQPAPELETIQEDDFDE